MAKVQVGRTESGPLGSTYQLLLRSTYLLLHPFLHSLQAPTPAIASHTTLPRMRCSLVGLLRNSVQAPTSPPPTH